MPINEDFRDKVRSDIARQLLAGALANPSGGLAPILYVDSDGPDNSGYTPESWKARAERMVKNSVKLADMLLEELYKAELEYLKSKVCTCSPADFDPKCPRHGTKGNLL